MKNAMQGFQFLDMNFYLLVYSILSVNFDRSVSTRVDTYEPGCQLRMVRTRSKRNSSIITPVILLRL